jgi:hypothetical protein
MAGGSVELRSTHITEEVRMESIYLWPGNPQASILMLAVIGILFLWAAREPMLKLLTALGGGLGDGLESVGTQCAKLADELGKRSRDILLAAGTRDAQARLDREFQRIDGSFSAQLGQFSSLHRRMDEQLLELEGDYKDCGIAPPEVPGWTAAVETISGIPMSGDPNIQKVLEGIKKSSRDAEKNALNAFRDESARQHKTLGSMLPVWKDIRGMLNRMHDSVGLALESTTRINAFVEDYEEIRKDRDEAARALTFSAVKLFFVSALVLTIALGGAFINFQLIALPMSELVPAGARVGGVPVSTVAALVIVLMEAALGIFLMDLLGITDLFPKLATIPRDRRRMILGLAFVGLLFLSCVEASLAILREQIVEADTMLKMALAGEEGRVVLSASQSRIPVIGQAALGFILPWVLALVAVPLELLLDSGRHVAGSLAVVSVRSFGHLCTSTGHVIKHLTGVLVNLYDVLISIPLRIESAIRGDTVDPVDSIPRKRRASSGGVA